MNWTKGEVDSRQMEMEGRKEWGSGGRGGGREEGVNGDSSVTILP